MFRKSSYCALVAMITLTRSSKKGLSVQEIAQENNIPAEAFDGIVSKLAQCGFVKIDEGVLSLNICPEDIIIWHILKGVTGENLCSGDFYSDITWQHRLPPSTTTIMLIKERELILKIIKGRLSRYKLSKWSEKVSKTVYV